MAPKLTAHRWIWSDGSLAGIEATVPHGRHSGQNSRGAMPAAGRRALTEMTLCRCNLRLGLKPFPRCEPRRFQLAAVNTKPAGICIRARTRCQLLLTIPNWAHTARAISADFPKLLSPSSSPTRALSVDRAAEHTSHGTHTSRCASPASQANVLCFNANRIDHPPLWIGRLRGWPALTVGPEDRNNTTPTCCVMLTTITAVLCGPRPPVHAVQSAHSPQRDAGCRRNCQLVNSGWRSYGRTVLARGAHGGRPHCAFSGPAGFARRPGGDGKASRIVAELTCHVIAARSRWDARCL